MKNKFKTYSRNIWLYHLLNGILLILLGILIILEPRVLIYLGAGILFFIGFIIIMLGWKIKKFFDFFKDKFPDL